MASVLPNNPSKDLPADVINWSVNYISIWNSSNASQQKILQGFIKDPNHFYKEIQGIIQKEKHPALFKQIKSYHAIFAGAYIGTDFATKMIKHEQAKVYILKAMTNAEKAPTAPLSDKMPNIPRAASAENDHKYENDHQYKLGDISDRWMADITRQVEQRKAEEVAHLNSCKQSLENSNLFVISASSVKKWYNSYYIILDKGTPNRYLCYKDSEKEPICSIRLTYSGYGVKGTGENRVRNCRSYAELQKHLLEYFRITLEPTTSFSSFLDRISGDRKEETVDNRPPLVAPQFKREQISSSSNNKPIPKKPELDEDSESIYSLINDPVGFCFRRCKRRLFSKS